MANTIIDDYELVNCLATGNISQIWEVKQVSSSQMFAMKLLLPEALTDSDHKASLKHEASVGKKLDHPNIIRIQELKISKKHGYFIMEYFRAPNLKSMLRNDLTGARVRVKKLMECVTQALAHMHEKGWVHRDVKPDNILISKSSEVRLIDFSLAAPPKGGVGRLLHSKRKAIIPGTRSYLSPELIQREPLSIAADIYSLGVTLYEVLCGRAPFISGNPNELLMMHVRDRPEKPSGWNENITPECDALVLSMLAKKPKDRPGSMQEIFAAVRNLKFFKIDADEHAKAHASKKADDFSKSLARLESRLDAGRNEDEKKAVAAEQKRIKEQRAAAMDAAKMRLAKKSGSPVPEKAAATPQPTAPAPMAPPGYGYPPGYPGQMMPGYAPMPGMPMPGMPMPGMGMPGMPMPGMPMPGMPVPGQPMPGMPPGAMPPFPGTVPRPPLAPAPLPPGAKVPGRKPAAPQQPVEEIPLMEELPDVM